jgi:probable rRNA maturation factor
MKIEINNLTDHAVFNRTVDKKVFSTVAKIVLKGENRESDTLSLAFVDKVEIKKLNNKFRHKNKPTDVLSFNLDEKDCLGEVVICPEVVKEKNEVILEVFIHGILHLCGYDHERSKKDEEIMNEKQKKYLSKIKDYGAQ